jgi:hypothetical protein
MKAYSNKIIAFLKDATEIAKRIVLSEMKLPLNGNHFLYQGIYYSLKMYMHNDSKALGYFDVEFQSISLHQKLMGVSQKQLEDIIRHELAHYFLYIIFPSGGYTPHGPEFKALCLSLGWGESVYRATMELDTDQMQMLEEESAILRKVKKLMALSSSTNQHEAEQALLKAQEILLKHNLENVHTDLNGEETSYYMVRMFVMPRLSRKVSSISRILSTFFVTTINTKHHSFSCLDVVGTKENLEISQYVAHFLDIELDRLWLQVKKEYGLSGLVAKNSFMMGVAQGYLNKIERLKFGYTNEQNRDLIVLENQLDQALEMIYPHLTKQRRTFKVCSESNALGVAAGGKLSINPAVATSSDQTILIGRK